MMNSRRLKLSHRLRFSVATADDDDDDESGGGETWHEVLAGFSSLLHAVSMHKEWPSSAPHETLTAWARGAVTGHLYPPDFPSELVGEPVRVTAYPSVEGDPFCYRWMPRSSRYARYNFPAAISSRSLYAGLWVSAPWRADEVVTADVCGVDVSAETHAVYVCLGEDLLDALLRDGRFDEAAVSDPATRFVAPDAGRDLDVLEIVTPANVDAYHGARVEVRRGPPPVRRRAPPARLLDKTCDVCLADPVEIAHVPCGHVICGGCALRVAAAAGDRCHMCREAIMCKVKIKP